MSFAPPLSELATTTGADVFSASELPAWAFDLASPPEERFQRLKHHLLTLQHLLTTRAPSPGERIVPQAYWPAISQLLQTLRSECHDLMTEAERCKPWVRVTLSNLKQRLDLCFRFYGIEDGERTADWCPRPLSDELRSAFDRLIYTFAELPSIALWRPIESSKLRRCDPDALDELTARVVAKVFDEYRDDVDWLTWGTVLTLREECERQLEQRRDWGSFHASSPLEIRNIRLLANRLGCEEPTLEFEEMNRGDAFRRSICDQQPPWPAIVDNEVQQWLRRIVAWSEQHMAACESSEEIERTPETRGPATYKPPKKWTAETANRRALELASEDPEFLNKKQRQWAKLIGCSAGLISKVKLWNTLQQWKKDLPSGQSVSALSTKPRFLQEAVSDPTLHKLISEQIDDDENGRGAFSVYERSQQSLRS